MEAQAAGEHMNFGNNLEDIARAFATFPKATKDEIDAASGTPGNRTVIFTQGKHPALVIHNGQIQYYPVTKYLVPKERIVDTNGAGDAFVGGFLASVCRSITAQPSNGRPVIDMKRALNAGE